MGQVLSHSRLETVQSCEYKHYKRYVLKEYPTRQMSFFLFGKAIHSVIEAFYKNLPIVLSEKPQQQDFLLRELMSRLVASTSDSFISGVYSLWIDYNRALTQTREASGKTSRPKTTSYWLQHHKKHFEQAFSDIDHVAILKFPGIVWHKPFSVSFALAIQCLENFLTLHYMNHNEGYVLWHEHKLNPIIIFDNGIGGIIDRVEWDNANAIFNIVDYKTGQQAYTPEGLSLNDQLCLYAYIVYASLCDGAKPNKVAIWDLIRGKVIETIISQKNLDDFLKRLEVREAKAQILYDKQLGKMEEELEFKTPAYYGRKWECSSCEYAFSQDGCRFSTKG